MGSIFCRPQDTDTMEEAIKSLEALKKQYDDPSIQGPLRRLDKDLGRENVEEWARKLYVAKRDRDDPNSIALNQDRKVILNLIYDLVNLWNKVRDELGGEAADDFEDQILDIFEARRIERILGFGVPMDRAQSLYAMKLPTKTQFGMHWYCEYHFDSSSPYCNYNYAQDQTDEEQEEWLKLLSNYPGFPTMNKRLYQLLFSEKLGLQRRFPDTFGRWSKPQSVNNKMGSVSSGSQITMAEAVSSLEALKKQYNEPSILGPLRRLGKDLGYENVEEWARKLYLAKRDRDDPNSIALNEDRKVILNLIYDLVNLWNKVRSELGDKAADDFEDKILEIFAARRIERILGFGVPMDRAQALYAMKLPTKTHYGMHWYCKYHFDSSLPYCNYNYDQDQTEEEREEWRSLLLNYPGHATMNKRLYQLLFSEKLGLQRRFADTFGHWSKPQLAAFEDVRSGEQADNRMGSVSSGPRITMDEAVRSLKALKKQFDEPSIQGPLRRLDKDLGYENVEEWARKLYLAKRDQNPNSMALNEDRKVILNLIYDMVNLWNKVRSELGDKAADDFEDKILDIFEARRIERILGFGVPMDRAQSLYAMKLPTKTQDGMHWYCEYHFDSTSPNCNYNYDQDQTDEEQEEWRKLLSNYPGFPTMNKRLYQLLFSEKMGLRGRHPDTFGRWCRPQKAVFESGGNGDLLTVFQASPLTRVKGDEVLAMRPTIDLRREEQILRESLNIHVDIDFETATSRNIGDFLRRSEGHAMHISCHASVEFLALDDGFGARHELPTKDLQGWIRATKKDLKFVFVSACSSLPAGETFVKAGVPHVICCRGDIEDTAAIVFTQAFYHALANDMLLGVAFEAARQQVLVSPDIPSTIDRRHEMDQFILLGPEGIDHNVHVFASHLRPSRRAPAEARFIPLPPAVFEGRELDVKKIMDALKHPHVISVTGPPRVGKASIAQAVCLYYRRTFPLDNTVWVPLDPDDDDDLGVNLMKVYDLLRDDRAAEALRIDSVYQGAQRNLFNAFQHNKGVIVIDTKHLPMPNEKLSIFVEELAHGAPHIRIIIIHDSKYSVPVRNCPLSESIFSVRPLDFETTVKLFGIMCRMASTRQLLALLPPQVNSRDLIEHSDEIFKILGEGNPRQIRDKAKHMSEEEYDDLIKQTINVVLSQIRKDDANVVSESCVILANFARVQAPLNFFENSDGIVDALVEAMRRHKSYAHVTVYASAVLRNLSWYEAIRSKIVNSQGIDALLSGMKQHEAIEIVQEYACGAISNLATDIENHEKIKEGGGIDAIIKAMGKFEDKELLQIAAIAALRNLANSPESRAIIKQLNGFDAIQRAMKLHEGVETIQEHGRNALILESLDAEAVSSNVGSLPKTQGDLGRAMVAHRKLAPDSFEVANPYGSIGGMLHSQSDSEGPLIELSKAPKNPERLPPDSLEVAESYSSKGAALFSQGDFEGALVEYRRALRIQERVAPDSFTVATSYDNIGEVLYSQCDLEGALIELRKATKIRERLAPNSLDVATSHRNVGFLLDKKGDLVGAIEEYENALEIEKLLSPGSLIVACSYNSIGEVRCRQGDLAGALEMYQEALEIGKDSLDVATFRKNIGFVLYSQGNLEGALKEYRSALEIQEQSSPSSLDVAESYNSIGSVLYSQGNLEEALMEYKRALDIREQSAPDSLTAAASYNNIGSVLKSQGDLEGALKYFRKALEIQEQLAPDSFDLATTYNSIGAVLKESM